MSRAIRKSSKQKQKLYKKSRRWTYMQKLQKPFRKIKEKIQAKLLFESIRKTQRQRKTTMAYLERNHRKSSEEKSVSTNNT